MMTQTYKNNPMFKIIKSTAVTLPTPNNISLFWNFGSLLFMCLSIQILSGLLLATSYSPNMELSFIAITKMMETNDSAWLIRYVHTNGASLFFICMYLHISRGLYYSSYLFKHTWNIGVSILLMTMAAAFLGYVLPVNQMSFWGASVITNLFSEVPYIGPNLVQMIWGALSISDPTLMRFFTLHFIIPFGILMMTMLHIVALHQTGSNNPLGLMSNYNKNNFHPYLSIKDLMGIMMTITMFMLLVMYDPLALGDLENFTKTNPSVTPHHIQPEWYFLFAYAILRAIPNKLGGVMALAAAVLILYTLPMTNVSKKKNFTFYPLNKMYFWAFIASVILLTWIGMRPVEDPYILTGQILTLFYFMYYIISPLMMKSWDMFTHI